MNTEIVNPLFDDFLRVGVLLALGLNFSPVPGWLHACSLPLLFLILAVELFVEWRRKRLPQEEQRDRERAITDERNLMIREKAAWKWTGIEYWLMLVAFWVIGVVFHRFDIAYALYWCLVIHWLGLLATRWWLNRKY